MNVGKPFMVPPPPEPCGPAAAANGGEAQAWRREMEKAQATEWFHGAADRAPARHPGDPREKLPGQAGGHGRVPKPGAMQAPAFLVASPAHAPGSSESLRLPGPVHPAFPLAPSFDLQAPAMAAASGIGGAVSAVSFSVQGPLRAGTAAALVAVPVPPGGEPEPRSGLRMHMEHGPHGTTVWLGVDGDAASVAARAWALVTDLRRELQASGRPLHAVVCNGRTLFQAGEFFPSKEP